MIDNEVKIQIQTHKEMAAMQEVMNQVSTKIDTIQGSIQEAIGSAIQDTLPGVYPNNQPQHRSTNNQLSTHLSNILCSQPSNSRPPSPSHKSHLRFYLQRPMGTQRSFPLWRYRPADKDTRRRYIMCVRYP